MCITIVCMLLQLFISTHAENIESLLIIGLATSVTISYLYWVDTYSKTAISTVVIISLLFTGLFGALVLQTLYWNPLTKYLYNPVYTFNKLTFYLLICIAGHYIYLSLCQTNININNKSPLNIRGILSRIGLYNIPSVYTVWIIAILGLLALIIGKLLPGTIGRALLNFHFLMWFPFFIIFYINKFGQDYASPKKQYTYILLFFILIASLGIALNIRALIVSGFVNLFLIAIIILLNQSSKLRSGFYFKFSILILILFGLLKPLSSFSDAMLIARSERGEITPIQMLINTFDIYLSSDTTKIEKPNKFIEDKVYSNYDEDYIENGILTRFVLTKFHDNAYHFASQVSDKGEKEVREHIIKSLVAIMPQPALDILGVELNKSDVLKSTTDILVYETTGRRLGGFKVPSTFVDLEITFDLFAPLVFLCMAFVFFMIVDLFSNNNKSYGLVISFPFFALASRYILFQMPVYGLQGVFTLVLRGFIEDVLIFCLLMYAMSYIFKPFSKDTRV